MEENKYIKGFNSGYLMRKFKPELYKQMVQGMESSSDYSTGIVDGGGQYETERTHQQIKQRMDKAKSQGKDQSR